MNTLKLTQAELKEHLHYDPLTGKFTYIKRKSGIRLGQIAGCTSLKGYIDIKVNGKSCRAGRLAFLYMTGSFPKHQADHINKIRDDNRWANLQDITNKENCHKKGMNKNNTSGITGVRWNKKLGKYVVTLSVSGKTGYFGCFSSLKEATRAIRKAKKDNGYHKDHGVTV